MPLQVEKQAFDIFVVIILRNCRSCPLIIFQVTLLYYEFTSHSKGKMHILVNVYLQIRLAIIQEKN